MKSLLAFFLFITILSSTSDISMLGIELYDSRESIEKLNLEVVGEKPGMIKYRTAGGNDFSITFDKGNVVYMENDWLQGSKSKEPLFTDFSFGKTTLEDIREKYKSNGFSHKNRMIQMTDDAIIDFSCFEFDSQKGEVLVVITVAPLTKDLTAGNIHENLKLEAVVIADKEYLNKIWGEEKVYSDDYKKIRL